MKNDVVKAVPGVATHRMRARQPTDFLCRFDEGDLESGVLKSPCQGHAEDAPANNANGAHVSRNAVALEGHFLQISAARGAWPWDASVSPTGQMPAAP